MSVRKFSVALGTAAMVVSGLGAAAMAPANADPASTPSTTDYVGVGSDTTQFVVTDLINGKTVNGTTVAGYNAGVAAGSPKMASFDACTVPTGKQYPCTPGVATDPTTYITLRTGSVPISRPNGSGAGKALLYGSTDNPDVTFARSSSGLSSAEASAGLVAYPFAVDTLVTVTSPNSNAPATLTGAQVLGIYNGTYTNWNQLGGKDGTINALQPQSGSGTLSFFLAQLATLNGGAAVTSKGKDHELVDSSGKPCATASATCVDTKVQEHDPTLITNDPNAIAPFSLGRANLANSSSSTPAVKVETGWNPQRALYNVLRSKDAGNAGKTDNSAWFAGTSAMDAIFGTSGFLCSAAARPIIEADGFKQLKSLTDGGSCGTRVTTTSAPDLSVYNATPTPTVSGNVTGSRYGSAHTMTVAVTGSNPSAQPTGSVSITFGGSTQTATLSGGTATLTLPTTLSAGSYTATVSYPGDANYGATTGTVSFTVSKASTATTATFPGKVKKNAKKLTGTVSVVSAVSGLTGAVKVTLGGKTLGTATLSNGKAKLSIAANKLKKGKNKLVALYTGTTNFSSSSKTFTVKK